VLLRSPEQVPKLVSLLAESYNPHVRYGACIAVGVACARTGSADAVALLEPMLADVSDFVRQGALLATAMVLQQESETRNPKAKAFREKIRQYVSERSWSTMTKMGAVLAQGIIDAGGRNVGLSLRSRAGFVKQSAVVGMAVFLQHWYWHPYLHFLSLSLAPTAVIGLNKDLQLPASFAVTCLAKPSDFAYPAPLEEKKEEKKERVQTVELSTTAKARAKAKAKAGEESVPSVDTPAPVPETPAVEEKPKPEPASFVISNPGRVTFNQQVYCKIDPSQRFQPIRKDATKYFGVLLLRDTATDDAEVEFVRLKAAGDAEEEAAPPADFEWTITD